jgi:1,2-dihydroxy-3-keto-5-methylthiopentene dioxygenase
VTTLTIYRDDLQGAPEQVSGFEAIAARLAGIGVQFERWEAAQPLSPGAAEGEVLEAYRAQVAALNQRYGFQSIDVVSLGPDHPDRETLRQKFLAEHRHADFEVRFFVAGQGLFYLHVGDRVYLVLCERGDLISVPAGTTHWFDMGERPDFTCIRFFTTPAGWEGEFTGSRIADSFPRFDEYVAGLR